MPILSHKHSPDGLALKIKVGLEERLVHALQAAQMLVPPLETIRGLIDTACDVSAVAPWVFQHFGISPFRHAPNLTAGGNIRVRLFKLMLGFAGPTGSTSMPLFPTLTVSELAQPLPKIDILVGLDVLKRCTLFIDGPRQQFSLAY